MRTRQHKGIRLSILAAAAAACVGFAGQARAQAPSAPTTKTMLTEPPTPLLPATLGKLLRVAPGDVGDGLGSVDAADAAVFQEDGLKRFARSDYGSADGKNLAASFNLTVYQFIDASGAASAFDYLHKPGMRPEKLGDQAVENADELLLRSGKNVVVGRFRLSHDKILAVAGELIGHLPKAQGTAALGPLLPSLLPGRSANGGGIDADSVRYALGPVGYAAMGGALPPEAVGFDKSAEAVTAKTKGGGVLTLVLYPTPEIAGEHLRRIEPAMKQRGEAAGTVVMRREGTLVAVTSGDWTAATAQATVEGIHLRTDVTFDKPMPVEFHAEVKKTYSLLVTIALFCAISCLAALVLGLFFGGGRALIRVMQGKSAASEPEFLRIDLRGSVGKRLGGPPA